MPNEQRTVSYSGRVQGVGFRFTACRIAARYEVTGYVRNLSNGRVECLVEGDTGEVEAFLGDLAAAMSGYILEKKQTKAPYSGLYKSFDVKF
ncbi:MAG: acylphosphatase [Planctomycetota bacterium]|jgi:acylphosphatase